MDKQTALIFVFLTYVAILPLFGAIYNCLYRRNSTSFIFAENITAARNEEEKLRIADRVKWLSLLISYLEQFVVELMAGEVEEYDLPNHPGSKAYKLHDNRVIVLTVQEGYHPDIGPYNLPLTIDLFRSDATQAHRSMSLDPGQFIYLPHPLRSVTSLIPDLKESLAKSQDSFSALGANRGEIWRFLDFLYFSTITQSTVGYGDILPNSTAVRAVVVIQIIVAYAILVVVLNIALI